ncbi:MAG: 2-polyprenyl-3-methyl-6-methoxy-1,4-benzoquinone monooxygenase [Pseudomonadota bacterium]
MDGEIMQQLTPLDHLIINVDHGLRTLFGQPLSTTRPNPAQKLEETELSETDKQLSARLMRVNHAGEVSAQALYQGQALTARTKAVRDNMKQSALEENDHLEWCQKRISELNGHLSFLNPLWYTGSYTIGAMAGAAGDKWSLGFVAETERQVVKHLEGHLQRLPAQDLKSKAILEQMKQDEAHHATIAIKAGGVPLPKPVRWLMGRVAKVMTQTAFWI